MRRPMSVYRVDRAAGQIEFLYKTEGRGTRGMALLAPGDDFNVAGPLGVGFKLDPAWKNHRGARPRRRAGDAGAAVAAGDRERRRRHRDPERAPCRRRDVAELFDSLGARTITVLDSDNTSAVENVEKLIEDLIGQGKADAFFTCGSNRLLKLMQRLGKKHGIPGQVAMEQIMVCGFGACYVCMRTFEVDGQAGAPAGLPRRAGVQHAGGRGMVDLSVKIGDITLQNPVTPASGAFSWEYNDVIDLNRLGGLVAKTICREPRLGNPTPRMAETEAGIIQSIGLPGQGHRIFHRPHRARNTRASRRR